MSTTSKRLRWVLALVITGWYYAGHPPPVAAMDPYCESICYWPGSYCETGCIALNGNDPYYSNCHDAGYPCEYAPCDPYWGDWTYVSTVAERNVTEFHFGPNHDDCFRERLVVAMREEFTCGEPDEYTCFGGEVNGTRLHNQSNCDPYYLEWGTWDCPY